MGAANPKRASVAIPDAMENPGPGDVNRPKPRQDFLQDLWDASRLTPNIKMIMVRMEKIEQEQRLAIGARVR